MIPVNLVLFAIQSAVKLGTQSRQAYVDATKRKALVLPLPEFNPKPDVISAITYFSDRDSTIIEPPELRLLLDKLSLEKFAMNNLTDQESQALLQFYREDYLLRPQPIAKATAVDGSVFNGDAVTNLVRVRQWQRGQDPHPSTLRRLAGTFVEIGVDYFAHVPEAINENSKYSAALRAFFKGLDNVKFASAPIDDLAKSLFSVTMETVAQHSSIISSDPKFQELITVTTTSLLSDVNRKLQEIESRNGTSLQQDQAKDWAQVIFRSILNSGGRLVVENPHKYLSVDKPGQQALVSQVGTALLDVVVDEPWAEALSLDSLNKIAKAALKVIGDHPQLVNNTNNKGLTAMISQVSSSLGQNQHLNMFAADMVPELTRLILDKAGENIELLWPELSVDPKRQLLRIGIATALDIVSTPPEDDVHRWQPRFTRENLMEVTEAVVDEFVDNPGWLVDAAGNMNNNLRIALESTVKVVRERGDARLSSKTATEILRAVMRAVAMQPRLLKSLPNGKNAIKAVLEIVFGEIFGQSEAQKKAACALVRKEVLVSLTELVLEKLSEAGLTGDNAAVLHEALKAEIEGIASGKRWNIEAFGARLEEKLG